jgi:hypothetical protein
MSRKTIEKLTVKDLQERLRELSAKPVMFDQTFMAERVERCRLLNRDAVKLFRASKNGHVEKLLWEETADLFHRSWNEAFPPNFWQDFEQLKNGYREGLSTGLKFLEADPWFFRSGYVKADLLRYVKKIEFTENETSRIERILLKVVDTRDAREFRDYCQLARVVKTEFLRSELEKRLVHSDQDICRRAKWMLRALN